MSNTSSVGRGVSITTKPASGDRRWLSNLSRDALHCLRISDA